MKASVLARRGAEGPESASESALSFQQLEFDYALTASDAAKAREMCILLGDFLRRTLGLGGKESIPSKKKCRWFMRILAVEKIRYGARLQMEESIDKEALDGMPPLFLQPLVENAVAARNCRIWWKAGESNLERQKTRRLFIDRR